MLVLLITIAAAAQAPAAPTANADPVICKRDKTSDVGTHMRPKPVCMKQSEWDLVERHTQDQLRTLGERSSFDPGKAGTPH